MNKLIIVNENGPAENKYDISINSNFEGLKKYFIKDGFEKYAKICVVTDSNVAKLYLNEIEKTLSGLNCKIFTHVFDAGEASKNCNTLNKLYEELIINHFDRHDLLIALGGGVVGDLCGYCAATYLRGIDYIQVPTTLLSQVDSSVGGKTAIDFMQYKNMVGAFYMPKLVYINVNVLKTLDDEQFSCGMGEVIKHGLIRDKEYYDYIVAHKEDIALKRPESLIELIYGSLAIKSQVVQIDPKEKGIRAYLNFGHTVGHAIEKLSDYKLYHGQCVAIGMMAALYLSKRMGYVDEQDIEKAAAIMRFFDLHTSVDKSMMDENAILQATKSDKKMDNNRIRFVILKDIGEAAVTLDVTDEMLLDAIRYIIKA
ncbi:MAG: 3-dehydroquinate synthase [Lachnospiraceae bacterium]|nr:3-dehydroquinate synthase [Lachnospiraceae bacterium]